MGGNAFSQTDPSPMMASLAPDCPARNPHPARLVSLRKRHLPSGQKVTRFSLNKNRLMRFWCIWAAEISCSAMLRSKSHKRISHFKLKDWWNEKKNTEAIIQKLLHLSCLHHNTAGCNIHLLVKKTITLRRKTSGFRSFCRGQIDPDISATITHWSWAVAARLEEGALENCIIIIPLHSGRNLEV